jgi:hypothetical protein
VSGFDAEHEYVIDNPESVIRVGPDDCDGGDGCSCTVISNPAANPLLDEHQLIGTWVTLRPCGDRFYVGRTGGGELSGWGKTTVTRDA